MIFNIFFFINPFIFIPYIQRFCYFSSFSFIFFYIKFFLFDFCIFSHFVFFFFPRTFFSFFSLSDSAIFFDDQSDINTFFFFFLFPFPLPSFLPGRCHMDLETRIVRGYSFRIDCSTIGNVQCIETKRKRKTNSLPGNLGFLCGKPVLPGHRVLNNLI